jgi:hypothetical protein
MNLAPSPDRAQLARLAPLVDDGHAEAVLNTLAPDGYFREPIGHRH